MFYEVPVTEGASRRCSTIVTTTIIIILLYYYGAVIPRRSGACLGAQTT